MTLDIKHAIALLACLGLVSTVACKSEIDNKPAATVKEADDKKAGGEEKPAAGGDSKPAAAADSKPAGDEKPAAAAGDKLEVDTAKSKIGFVGAKVTGDHTGEFKEFKGSGAVSDGKLSSVEFTVQMPSVETDTEKLTGHLKTPDFFDVENHPTSTFKSTKIEEKAADGATHMVTGNLTIKGITKEISFPATISDSPEAIKAKAEFTIKRFDWKIEYKGKADDLIKDEVLLKLDLVFPKKAA